jgi:hypothetical protein
VKNYIIAYYYIKQILQAINILVLFKISWFFNLLNLKKTLPKPHHFSKRECSGLQNCLTQSLFIEEPVSSRRREA